MEIFTNLPAAPANAASPVLAIGNFDGVHRGHQQLLAAARKMAAQEGAPFAVLTFEPHPRALFRPDDPPFRITPAAVKAWRLERCGAERLYILPFDWDFASQSAEQFIGNIIPKLNPRHIVVGFDFAFGQLRKGNAKTLRQAGYNVTIIDEIADEAGAKFSSSAIRTALRHGEIARANALLGWQWEIRGPVIEGDKRGRELGYPTANVPLGETVHPAYGVYATMVRIEGEGDWRPAATNIGIRPMFALKTGQVEAHILDFSGDIYGRILRIRPVARLRGEAKYDSLEVLIAQIASDCAETRQVLNQIR